MTTETTDAAAKPSATMGMERRIAADGCDVRRELPPAGLVGELIALATAHADSLDIGYQRLGQRNRLWVMGRMAIEMDRWPMMYDTYRIDTRVISFNRLFSERCFDISVNGEHVGESRTIWSSIDADSRHQADLSDVAADFTAISDRQPAMAPVAKIRSALSDNPFTSYTFGVTDLDFNGHVTTTRYVELMLNCMTVDEYKSMTLVRMDILFHREALCGAHVNLHAIREETGDTVTYTVTMAGACDNTIHTTARFILRGRQ